MKKLFLLLLAFMLLGFGMGCDGDTSTNANSAVPNNQFNKTGTIQGTVFDATTGERIGDSSLSITMVRGTGYYSPALLQNTTTDATRLGDFVFNGVPVTLNGDATYRIVASMDNYETFEGFFSPATALVDTNGDDAETEDTVYNFIGNIYMFPLGETAPSYTFYVEYDQEPVVGATVFMEYKPDMSNPTTNVIYQWDPDDGLNATMSGTTDATGGVTFAGSTLVLGGTYKITVLPVTHEGVQLARNDWGYVSVGIQNLYSNDIINVIAMSDLHPGNDDEGLVVLSASNRDNEDVVASGGLTLTFSRAVDLVDETDCTATLYSVATGAIDSSDFPNSTVTVSGTGTTTLTFTPNLSTAIDTTTDFGTYVVYSNCLITVSDDSYKGQDVFSVPYIDGGGISSRVNMTEDDD